MNRRAQLYEIRIAWFSHLKQNEFGMDCEQFDSINRYAHDDRDAETIGRKFARETLKATKIDHVTVRPLNL